MSARTILAGLATLLVLGSIVAGYFYVQNLQGSLAAARAALATEQWRRATAELAVGELRRQHRAVTEQLAALETRNLAAAEQWLAVTEQLDQIPETIDDQAPLADLLRLNGNANRMLERASRPVAR